MYCSVFKINFGFTAIERALETDILTVLSVCYLNYSNHTNHPFNYVTSCLFLTGKRCVKIELEVVQVKRSWASMWLLVSSHLTCIARFVHTIASLRESFGSVTVVETTVSLELTFFALGVWVVHAGVSLILSRSHIWV